MKTRCTIFPCTLLVLLTAGLGIGLGLSYDIIKARGG
jgi:hypothetical protein